MQANPTELSHPARDRESLLARSIAPVLAGAMALALYARSLPPGLTWGHEGVDGGDLLAAALTGGVPHPAGYPTYQLLLRLALAIAHAAPARTGAWLSAVSAALAVALLADLAQRSVGHGNAGRRSAASWAALIAGLAWAAAPGLWSQAVIVEVYALNGLVCVALLSLAWRWAEARRDGGKTWPWLAAAGLVFGLGLGNHVTVLLMLPGLGVWVWAASARSVEQGLRRDLIAAALATLLGLLVYAYLPLAASGSPPVNWGDPSSLEGFLWLITGRLYAGLALGLPLSSLPARLLGWATWSVRQFQPWGLLLLLAGLWRLERASRPWWLATLLVWLAFTAYAIGYNTTDSMVYLIPVSAVMALWLAEALYAGFVWAERWRGATVALALLALAALPAASVGLNWQDENLSRDREAEAFMASALDAAGDHAVILAARDDQTFALWYAVYGLRRRPDLTVLNVNLYGYDWYRRTLAKIDSDLLPSGGEAPRIEPLIADLLRRRPVYAADELNLNLRGVIQTRHGVLIQLGRP